MKYDVHIFAIVRVKRTGIEASSQEDAVKKAEEITDLDRIFNNHKDGDLCTEWTDDIDGYFVDEDSDPEHEKSRWYDKSGKLI